MSCPHLEGVLFASVMYCSRKEEGREGGSLVLGIDIAHAENDNLNDAKVEEEMEFTYRLQ